MTVQPIRLFGDPVLRSPADAVVDFDKELRRLVKDLTETMRDEGGAGLAAPQLGVGLRVFAFDVDDVVGHIVNPVLSFPDDEEQDGPEGCLSIPGVYIDTKRRQNVVAQGFTEHGDPLQLVGTGLMARCVQHETDHLDGVLFLDRLDAASRKEAMKQIRAAEWYNADKPPADQAEPAQPGHLRRGAVSGLRLVFAGTPGRRPCPASTRSPRPGTSCSPSSPGPTRPPAGAGTWSGRPPGRGPTSTASRCSLRSGPREPEFQQRLRELAPDCVPVVAYGALVPPSALEIPKRGWVNLHFSLLPAWRGAAPVQHAVLHGDEVTGASVFELEAGLDTGPVYGTLTEDIRPTDTSGDLLERLATEGAGLLVAVLDAIEAGTARAHPQPADGVTIAPKLTVEDARVRWDDPAFAVDRRVRACTPAPGRLDDAARGPAQARPGPAGRQRPRLAPGDLLVERSQVLVGTATTPVALGEVRAAGKKADAGHRLGPRPAHPARGEAPVTDHRADRPHGSGRPAPLLRARLQPGRAAPGGRRGPVARRRIRRARRRTRRSRRCTGTTRTRTWS